MEATLALHPLKTFLEKDSRLLNETFFSVVLSEGSFSVPTGVAI